MSEQKMREAFKAAFQKAHWLDHKTYDECIDAGITAALAAHAGEQVGLTDQEMVNAYESEQQGRWGDHIRSLQAVIAAHEAKRNGGAA